MGQNCNPETDQNAYRNVELLINIILKIILRPHRYKKPKSKRLLLIVFFTEFIYRTQLYLANNLKVNFS